MAQPREHGTDGKGKYTDGEAKLSAAYASRYYVAAEITTLAAVVPTEITPCANCAVAVAPTEGERREPVCPTCWAMLQQSIKRAAKLGFRIG